MTIEQLHKHDDRLRELFSRPAWQALDTLATMMVEARN
jgi:hypothetical protein